MALKKPGELFGEKIKVETPVKVEELQKQTDSVSSSLTNSLTEAIDKNLNLLSKEYSEKLDKFTHKIDSLKEEINIKLNSLEKTDQYLKGEIGVVEQRQQTNNFDKIKKQVISEIKQLEDKIEIIKEAYEENILKEGLLNEPPSTDNSDPLTPLDQKFVTLDKFEEHYTLFVNRIQKQLSTLGGGGAVNIKDMDDVDSSAFVNGKTLEYDSTLKKWKGGTGGGSGIGTENVSTSTLNVVGVSTFNDDVVFKGASTNARWDKSKNDLVLYNSTRLTLGDNEDFQMWHGGTHTFIKNTGGDLRIRGNVIKLTREDSSERYIECNVNNAVQIFHNGSEKFATTGIGVTVFGNTETQSLNVTAGISTFRSGINVIGLTYTDGDVTFNGDAYNALWDKSDNALEFTDNAKATFGAGTDLEIYSNGTNGVVGGAVSFTSDVTVGTSQAVGVVLTSPNGTKYRLVVANDGTLSTTAV